MRNTVVFRKRNKTKTTAKDGAKDGGDVLGKDWTKKVEEAKDSLDEEKLRRSSSVENLAGKSPLISDET